MMTSAILLLVRGLPVGPHRPLGPDGCGPAALRKATYTGGCVGAVLATKLTHFPAVIHQWSALASAMQLFSRSALPLLWLHSGKSTR
jgi:hypothetical protein